MPTIQKEQAKIISRRNTAHISDDEGRKVLAEAVVWLAIWMIVSPLVILQISHLMRTHEYEFPYSWGFLGFSNIITFASAWILMKAMDSFNGGETSKVQIDWDKGAILGVMHGFEVGLGAVVMRAVTVQLRTELHMLAPTFMYIFGLLAGLESCAPQLVLSVVLITAGGLMCLHGQVGEDSSTMAIVPVAVLSGLFACGRWVLTQRWLAPKGSLERPSPMMLLTRMSPATGLTGLVGAIFFEREMYSNIFSLPDPEAVWSCICFIGVAVVLMTVAELRVCQLMSALLLGMLTPLHNVTIIVWGIFHSGTSTVTLFNWAGLALCSMATALYSWARHAEASKVIAARELAQPLNLIRVEE